MGRALSIQLLKYKAPEIQWVTQVTEFVNISKWLNNLDSNGSNCNRFGLVIACGLHDDEKARHLPNVNARQQRASERASELACESARVVRT